MTMFGKGKGSVNRRCIKM